jgi:hypothetical protein
MFQRRHFEQIRDLFAEQFEPDGADYLYRRSQKGAPIRVSASEREAFLSDFQRNYGRAFWGFLIAIILGIFGLVALLPDAGGPVLEMLTGFLILPLIVLLGVHWIWSAPARALRQRQPVGFERSRDEMRAIKLAKITYANLAIGALAVPLLLLKVAEKFDVLHGWGRLWLLFAGALAVLIAVQAVRKWRFERRSRL